MGLFSPQQLEAINKVAAQSKELLKPAKSVKTKSIVDDLNRISQEVQEYFKDSEAILIESKEQLHEYVTNVIAAGIAGIDTETTGLDRVKDYIVGASLYYPGGVECYIPMKHMIPIFDSPYKNQLSYEDVAEEFQRLVDNNVKLIFANADFDLAMIYKDLKVDLLSAFYYDVILAWRCLKENESDNSLKGLYNKYPLHGKGDPKKFSDFFTPTLFPYCKPQIAKLYAANDAKITYLLYIWQLPYVTPDHRKCIKAHLEAISRLVWDVEFPLVQICQEMHRLGIYVDRATANVLVPRYKSIEEEEHKKLIQMVDDVIATNKVRFSYKSPFPNGAAFNPNSTPQVKYLIYTLLNVTPGKDGQTTDKDVLKELNIPVINQILKVRSLRTLISTFVEKMPSSTTRDGRIHAEFKQIGAATGRFASQAPNVQNIPSHALDIRHMFRATPAGEEIIDCTETDNTITASLFKYDTVTNDSGNDIEVKDLKIGDKIKLLEDKSSVIKTVTNISVSTSDLSMIDITFA